MKWAEPRPGGHPGSWTHKHLRFHDLLDDGDYPVGTVREDTRTGHGFLASLNDRYVGFPTTDTLDESKALLITHLVKLRFNT